MSHNARNSYSQLRSPTTSTSYIPTRPAPSPPGLPPTHPFAQSYNPPFFPYHQAHNTSMTSLSSGNSPSCPTSPQSTSSQSSHSSLASLQKNATSSLAAPLSPRPANVLSHYHRSRFDQAEFHGASLLPPDLSLFDPRPRQTLLQDLELIIGKRLTFPLLDKLTKAKHRQSRSATISAPKIISRDSNSSHSGQKGRRVLRKERERSWEEDFAWDGVCLITDEESKYTRGRGVRKGNWV